MAERACPKKPAQWPTRKALTISTAAANSSSQPKNIIETSVALIERATAAIPRTSSAAPRMRNQTQYWARSLLIWRSRVCASAGFIRGDPDFFRPCCDGPLRQAKPQSRHRSSRPSRTPTSVGRCRSIPGRNADARKAPSSTLFTSFEGALPLQSRLRVLTSFSFGAREGDPGLGDWMFKGFLLTAALAGAAVVAASPAHAGVNLLRNGDFGTGDFTDWTYSSTKANEYFTTVQQKPSANVIPMPAEQY